MLKFFSTRQNDVELFYWFVGKWRWKLKTFCERLAALNLRRVIFYCIASIIVTELSSRDTVNNLQDSHSSGFILALRAF